jgi:hypothetical protein
VCYIDGAGSKISQKLESQQQPHWGRAWSPIWFSVVFLTAQQQNAMQSVIKQFGIKYRKQNVSWLHMVPGKIVRTLKQRSEKKGRT